MDKQNNKEVTVETAKLDVVAENGYLQIKLKEFHSKQYLEKMKKTTYKDKKVVFILPNGKEYK